MARGKRSGTKVNYRLRDWLFPASATGEHRSRSSTVTIVEVPVPEHDLPVLLPTDVTAQPANHHSNIQRRLTTQRVQLAKTGTSGGRYDGYFCCSSWYYFRFADPHNTKEFASKESIENGFVDMYMGGAEHTVLHLMYARFLQRC